MKSSSLSYSSSPRGEENVVDADDIERWLTGMTTTTMTTTTNASIGRLTRRQPISPTRKERRHNAMISKSTSTSTTITTLTTRHSPRNKCHTNSSKDNCNDPVDLIVTNNNSNNFTNDNDDERHEGSHLATRVSKSGMAPPGIDAVRRRRRQQRLRRREFNLERIQQHQEQRENHLGTTVVTLRTQNDSDRDRDNDDLKSKTRDIVASPPSPTSKQKQSSNRNLCLNSTVVPIVSHTIYNDVGVVHGDVDNNNICTVNIDNKNGCNDDENDGGGVNDIVNTRFTPIPSSKKIHLLKHHDVDKGGSLLSAAKGPLTRRQTRSVGQEALVQYPYQLQCTENQHHCKSVYNNCSRDNDILDHTSANIKNTKLLKEAVARSRSSRRNNNKYIHDSRISNDLDYNSTYGGMLLKRHFHSGRISCSSVSTTVTVSGVSVNSNKSNNSQFTFQSSASEEENDDDEETTITSTSGTTHTTTSAGDNDVDDDEENEEISQLSIPIDPRHYQETNHTMTSSRSWPKTDRKLIDFEAYEENKSSSFNQNTVLRQEEQRSQIQSLIPKICKGSDEQSAVTTLVKTATGVATTVSSLLMKSLPQKTQQELTTNRIKLNVYDLVANDTQLDLYGYCHFPLGQVFNAFNSSLHSIGTGAYHVGVEVNSVEYAYGANTTKDLTGVYTCLPKTSPGYQYRTTIDFGDRLVVKHTNKIKKTRCRRDEAVHPAVIRDGREIIRLMATEYLGTDYDLLRKNCCTFSHDACIRLGISEEEIPSWFHNLASAGAVTQDAANFTLSPITQFFCEGGLDKCIHHINEKSLDDKIEAIPGISDVKKSDDITCNTAYQL